ncbi:MAG TPA: hypothetical protein VFP86_00690 [bacterium]|nr:hypothetical protein [bacterium]
MSHDLHGSSDLDLAILVHLRGYPEDLRLAAAPGFPPPVWGDGRHRVWRRADIPVTPRAADDPPHRAS